MFYHQCLDDDDDDDGNVNGFMCVFKSLRKEKKKVDQRTHKKKEIKRTLKKLLIKVCK